MTKSKIASSLIAIILSCLALVGCFKPEPVESNEPRVLRILGDKYFIENYSSYFKFANNNVELKIINAAAIFEEVNQNAGNGIVSTAEIEEKFINLITGPTSPDVIFLTETQFLDYVEKGLITALDSFIEKDKFDLNEITPSVIDTIKFLGDGSIYALSPTFNTQVLYYNKEIFDRRSIPYPEDRMGWDEIFNLAKQLSYKENDIQYYGIAYDKDFTEYRQMEYYLQPLNFSIFNVDYTSITVNSPEWEKIWGDFAQLHQLGAISPHSPIMPGSYNKLDLDLFLKGQAAMAIGGYDKVQLLNQINRRVNNAIQPEKIEWNIVSLPIHPELGDIGGDLELPTLMAINAKSDQQELAWKYILFMNGDKMGRILSDQDRNLPARFQYAKKPAGIDLHIEAFTLLKPALNDSVIDFHRLYPKNSPDEITWLGNQLMKDVINERTTVKEALQIYEAAGQKALANIIQSYK